MTSIPKQQAEIHSEITPLLQSKESSQSKFRRDGDGDDDSPRHRGIGAVIIIRGTALLLLLVLLIIMAVIYFAQALTSSREDLLATTASKKESSNRNNGYTPTTVAGSLFPPDFIWGAATSSYQIEGGVQERGWTVWDTFCHQSPSPISDNSTGDRACDHYHLYKQDVESIMKRGLNLTAYRFSMAWSRILPTGQIADGIHQPGVDFYNHLIDTLLANDIMPVVTLFHWDTPQALQDKYGGWMSAQMADIFANDYAKTAFELFGDRVQYWITLNEPWTVAVNGYSTGIHAPGHSNATEPYIVAHNLLLAHAKAVLLYKQDYHAQQQGKIGIANSGDYRYAASTQKQDRDAAERAMLFQFGWFVDPLIFGDYPAVMKERVGDRLPDITPAERELFLKASTDFLGLNYYSVFVASTPNKEADYAGYWADIHVNFTSRPNWEHNAMGWNVVPEGLEKMLLWVSHRYNYPTILITENGSAENESSSELLDSTLNDAKRKAYIQDHLLACTRAIQAGVHLAGYFVWSLMDNFEWQFGYTRRFGIYQVDFDTLERFPKSSALFYSKTIQENGENLRNIHNKQRTSTRLLKEGNHRQLPDRILMGYTKGHNGVQKAIQEGVNVVVWSFVDYVKNIETPETGRRVEQSSKVVMRTNLDITQVKKLIQELDNTGYGHVVHLMAVGGWNEPHLDPHVNPLEWLAAFKDTGFHGIDWDLEGNDDLTSPRNFFTIECLNQMGEISRLVHEAGYYVSMAPPQSYLDIHASHNFSRYVNFTDESRGWHKDFSYFGRNVYAYVLKQYGEWIDLVSIQFYESYSRAAQAIYANKVKPSHYLIGYVQQLTLTNQSFWVDFSQDPAVSVTPGNVSLPLSKLVLGFANGWAKDNNDKVVYIPPSEVNAAWHFLKENQLLPRGFMFWTIDEEGSNEVNLARDLGMILNAQCIE